MKDEKIEKALECCACKNKQGCTVCPMLRNKNRVYSCTIHVSNGALGYINRLKSEKQLAETRLKELLSALFKLTDNVWQAYDICRDDVIKFAKDYGIKEEELK